MVASASEKKLEGLKCAKCKPYQWLLYVLMYAGDLLFSYFFFDKTQRDEQPPFVLFHAAKVVFLVLLGSPTRQPFFLLFFSSNFSTYLSFFLFSFQNIRTKLALTFNLRAIAKSTTEMDRKPI